MTQSQPIIIDVREIEEYNNGHAANAINIPVGDINSTNELLASLPKNSQIIVYCRSGVRAGKALKKLQQMGFTNITNGINQQMIKLLRYDSSD